MKIDRCFVADLPHDAKSAAITRAIVQLAQGLGIQVIAEGVENEASTRSSPSTAATSCRAMRSASRSPTRRCRPGPKRAPSRSARSEFPPRRRRRSGQHQVVAVHHLRLGRRSRAGARTRPTACARSAAPRRWRSWPGRARSRRRRRRAPRSRRRARTRPAPRRCRSAAGSCRSSRTLAAAPSSTATAPRSCRWSAIHCLRAVIFGGRRRAGVPMASPRGQPQQHVGLAAPGDDGRGAAARRALGGEHLGEHAAAADGRAGAAGHRLQRRVARLRRSSTKRAAGSLRGSAV